MEKIKVLYVDDEQNNLNGFKASFRRIYDVYIASSAAEGLQLLAHNSDIHVVIADQRMPDMTGVDFFEILVEQYPDTVRILITAYSDIEAVINAINKGRVYRYIKKPWDEQELKVCIDNAFELYYTKKQLHETNIELTKANHELNSFVYSASHDLKAPLVSIMGILKLVELEGKVKDDYGYFKMIGESIRKLEAFIKNVINYYKNVRIDRNFNEIDFKKTVEETIETFNYYDEAEGVSFDVKINQSGRFVGDEFRIRLILNNLLSNSIKYQKPDNDDKKISVEINADDNAAYMYIKDNGIGINEAYLPDIFKMFFRGTSQSNGAGIGLYIAKDAVTKMNAEIKVSSVEGEGTAFEVRIPNMANDKRIASLMMN